MKKKLRKYRLMELHVRLTKTGRYMEAKNILNLLRTGSVVLGLSDADRSTEKLLEGAGCPVSYSYQGFGATFRI